MLKQLLHRISILLLLSASVGHLFAATDCSGYSPDYLDHYCDCNAAQRISDLSGLSDLTFSDSIWFRTGTKTFTEAGMTAYLFSESDVQVDIYQRCESLEKLYSFLVPKNQTRDLDKQAIQDKFEQNGGSLGSNMVIRVLFYPTDPGAECRLMCYPYNTGPHSTPEDPLPVLEGMTYVSSNAYDVYELKPDHIPASCALYTQWIADNNAPCHLRITRGSVNGEVVVEHDFLSADTYFHFDAQLLSEVRASGESLYMHFTHDASAAGRIITQEVHMTDIVTDITLCQGKTWEYNGKVYAESAIIPYDTVWTSTISMDVYKYNVVFTSPTPQYDTLALRYTELPAYSYRGEAIKEFGDYEFLFQTPNECDEHIFLHVRHNLTTITNVLDTTLCEGKIYVAPDGKKYMHDVTLIDSLQHNADTLIINQTNVHFSMMDVVYDTLAVKNTEIAKGVRLYNKYKVSETVRAFGDYKFIMKDAHNCPDSLYLHVCHDLKVVRDTVEKIFCDGMQYQHNGITYTSSITLVDTTWSDDGDTQTITTTQVLFVTNELHYDTLYLKTKDLPYSYKGQLLKHFGVHDLSFDYGECDQQVQVTIIHDIDTLDALRIDTTLCQGKLFTYKGVGYTSSTEFVDTAMYNADTCIITPVAVTFTAPEAIPDTLALKYSDLPYTYRGLIDTITAFGDYDLTIHTAGECDERYLVHVYHSIDTLRQSIDTILCQGKVFDYAGVEYSYNVALEDTAMLNVDTCIITYVSAAFTEPEVQTEYLGLKTNELPYTYRGLTDTITKFGDYDLTIHTAGECDERYLVHVYHKVDTLDVVVDTVLCQGKVFEAEGEQYTADTMLTQEEWIDDDTYQITTINLSFTEPEQQRISLPLKYSELPYTYLGLTDTITAFGDYDLTIHTYGECDERHLVHAYHKMDTIQQIVDSAVCGYNFAYEDKYYTEDKTFVTYLPYNQDTVIANVLNVYFTSEKVDRYQTLILKPSQLPYTYNLPDFSTWKITHFGDFDREYTNFTTWCDEHLHLHVQPLIDTLYQNLDTTFCQGAIYPYRNTLTITSDTTFADTLQRDADTYVITSVSVTFTAPEATPDTLALKQAALPYTYRGQETINAFGDYDLTIRTAGECDERYLLHVYHAIDTLYETISDTLCQGKSFTYNGVEYTSSTTFADTLQRDADTYVINSVSLTFTAPEAIPDTLALKQAALPYTYRGQETITTFGDYDLTIRTSGECDERYLLHVYHAIDTLYETISETLCQGKSFTYNGVTYTSSTTFADTLQRDADTYIITSVSLTFTAPEAIPDTLALKQAALPYTYRGQETITAFGDYDLTIRTAGECDERYLLHVYHDIDTLYTNIDTTLCEGRIFIHNELEYTQPAILLDSNWLNMDTWQITTIDIAFTTPDMEYDTIVVKTEELLAGFYYEPADTMVYAAGDYFYEILTYNDCTRHLTLTVNEELTSAVDNLPCTEQPRLIMRNGVVYIIRGKEFYTILGEKL